MATLGFAGAAVLLVIANQVTNSVFAMLLIGMASFCNDLVMPHAWASCMDIGGRYAGMLSGSMNMMGNLAGFAAPRAMPWIFAQTGSWEMVIYTMAASYVIGMFTWPFINPTKTFEVSE
jgi:nitrate/nitrite transporter NarK